MSTGNLMSEKTDYAREKLRQQPEDETELSPCEKVAVMMVALGQDGAADIMKFLTNYETEEITHTIAELKHLPVDVQDDVLAELEQHLLAGEYMSQGGVDFARDALERAVGRRKAQEILDRAPEYSVLWLLPIEECAARADRSLHFA